MRLHERIDSTAGSKVQPQCGKTESKTSTKCDRLAEVAVRDISGYW